MGHRYHPDPAKDPDGEHILYDDCGRCDEHASSLNTLDRQNLGWLVLVSDRGHFPATPTENERKAQSNIWRNMLLPLERLTGKDWREVVMGE